jgi:antirestriction protein ArdC
MTISHKKGRAMQSADRCSIYDAVTSNMITQLEEGCFPWTQAWREDGATFVLPKNASTRKSYSGINILILWDALERFAFTKHHWLTFKQALSLGGCVRKGEKGTHIVYADNFTPKSEIEKAAISGDEARTVPYLKTYTVFNVDQCQLPDELAEQFVNKTIKPERCNPNDHILPRVKSLMDATGADIRIGSDKAYYVPSEDFICLPHPEQFYDLVNFHPTALHELTHWSGHKSRLDRDLNKHGKEAYAREELIAELGSAFLCAQLGIEPTVRHADYLASWLAVLRDDNRAIFQAASQASKAADFILGLESADQDLVLAA